MHLRNQEKAVGMSNSFTYNYNLPNQESSAKHTSTIPERGREERPGTEDNSNTIYNPAPNYPDRLNLLHHRRTYQQQDGLGPRRDPDPPGADADADTDVGPIPITSRSNSNLNRPEPSASATATATATTGNSTVHYRECQRNHAAHLGGHVVDGCGEFMPGGEEGTPEFFKCAACDCHRNFHRKEMDSGAVTAPPPPPLPNTNCFIPFNPSKPINQKHMNVISAAAQPAPPQPQIPQQHQRVVTSVGPLHHPPTMMAFGGGGTGVPAESSSEELNIFRSRGQASESYGASKKRFRTKFTQEQKDRMMQFAEKIGWRIQKQDEGEVQQLCDEVGVKRQVFKVWMHNNRQAMKRKQP
ncbi:hypothetical protein Ancab_025834 [Ancistrocladus abbreviatus]